jgi:predicted kinase
MENNYRKPSIVILIGPSGSGKTTWTREFLKQHPKNWVRVNRDDMRRQVVGDLTPDYYKRDNVSTLEKHISNLLNESIRYWIGQGMNVILDNTHLKLNYIEQIYDDFEFDANISVKVIERSIAECKAGVIAREGKIDVSYIDHHFRMLEALKPSLHRLQSRQTKEQWDNYMDDLKSEAEFNGGKQCYIVDIDGTIADHKGVRSAYDTENVDKDKVIYQTVEALKALCRPTGSWLMSKSTPPTIIYLSGREEKAREKTLEWIKANKLPWDGHLYMRKTGDQRKDSIVKKELFLAHVAGRFHVKGVFDDRLQVTQMWHKLGLFVFNVNQGLKYF